MKRFAALLIAVVTCLAACSVGAWAEETAALVGTPGETVEIRFVVTANPNNAVAAMLELEYDHNALVLIPNGVLQTDRVIISGDLMDIPLGKEISAVFRIKSSAKQNQDYPLRLNVIEAYDINETAVDGFAMSQGIVSTYSEEALFVPYGFSDPLYVLWPRIQALCEEAFTWARADAPQTLDQFPLMVDDPARILQSLDSYSLTSEETQDGYQIDLHMPSDNPFFRDRDTGYLVSEIRFVNMTTGSDTGKTAYYSVADAERMTMSLKNEDKKSEYYYTNIRTEQFLANLPFSIEYAYVSWNISIQNQKLCDYYKRTFGSPHRTSLSCSINCQKYGIDWNFDESSVLIDIFSDSVTLGAHIQFEYDNVSGKLIRMRRYNSYSASDDSWEVE